MEGDGQLDQNQAAGLDAEIDRGAKQRYLVREIIDKGLDQEEFGTFLRKKKNSIQGVNALNVDLYSFDELDRHVQEFQLQDANPYQSPGKTSDGDDNWEDLEYAEETMRFGRNRPLQVSSSITKDITKQVLKKVARQPKKKADEKGSALLGEFASGRRFPGSVLTGPALTGVPEEDGSPFRVATNANDGLGVIDVHASENALPGSTRVAHSDFALAQHTNASHN